MGITENTTSGPWHIGLNPGPMIYGPKGEQIADLRGDMLPRDEVRANARLIAAAPDLAARVAELESALRSCITEEGAMCMESRPSHAGDTYKRIRLNAISNTARAALGLEAGPVE